MWDNLANLFHEIYLAIILSILGYICKTIYKKFKSLLYKRSMSFTIDGIWYVKHKNYQKEAIIEFIEFKQNREDLSIVITQYKEDNKEIYLFSGKGIFTTDIISLFYYSVKEELRQNGVMTLKITSLNINDIYLKGTYYEINSEKKGFYPLGSYNLYKLHIPLFKRYMLKFRKGVFSTYKSAEKMIEKYGNGYNL